jgi:hypothetical protein
LLARHQTVRVVTIKYPPPAIDGVPEDSNTIGKVIDLPPQVALLMIVSGWVRTETRSAVRRAREADLPFERRHLADRRSGGWLFQA